MEGAYFVGRIELLKWLNDFLEASYKKVEEVCSGIAYLQIMDAIYPGKVPLAKVKWDAKTEYDYIANFTLLQTVFENVGLDKQMDIPKLTKGKFQDNLEFLQWMKRWFDMHYNSENPYPAAERRSQYSKGKSTTPRKTEGVPAVAKPSPSKPVTPKPAVGTPTSSATTKSRSTSSPATKPPPAATKKPAEAPKAAKEDSAKLQQLQKEIEELQATATQIQSDRDFYLSKLQTVEGLCKESEENDLGQKILEILYAKDEGAQEENQEVQEEELQEVQEEPEAEAAPEEETY